MGAFVMVDCQFFCFRMPVDELAAWGLSLDRNGGLTTAGGARSASMVHELLGAFPRMIRILSHIPSVANGILSAAFDAWKWRMMQSDASVGRLQAITSASQPGSFRWATPSEVTNTAQSPSCRASERTLSGTGCTWS